MSPITDSKMLYSQERCQQMYVLIMSYGYPTTDFPLNGIFQFDQAKALAQAGCKVVMACIDLRSVRRKRKWGYEKFDRDGVTIACVNMPIGPFPKICNFIGKVTFSWLFKKICKELGIPHIVHAHFSVTAYAATATKLPCPFVVTEHGSSIIQEPIDPLAKKMAAASYGKADQVLSVSTSLGKQIQSKFHVTPIVVPNVVDVTHFQYIQHEIHERWISVGSLLHGKAMDVTIHAFVEYLICFPNARLTIVGDGPERSALQTLIDELGLTEKVFLAGQCDRSKTGELMANSDYFVLASRFETFGVVYIEALASGLPIVGTQCGGPIDFIDETNGILVTVDDINALKDAMVQVSQNKYNRAEISKQAVERFSPKAISTTLMKIYKKLLTH